jgi:hypothetical protein
VGNCGSQDNILATSKNILQEKKETSPSELKHQPTSQPNNVDFMIRGLA